MANLNSSSILHFSSSGCMVASPMQCLHICVQIIVVVQIGSWELDLGSEWARIRLAGVGSEGPESDRDSYESDRGWPASDLVRR